MTKPKERGRIVKNCRPFSSSLRLQASRQVQLLSFCPLLSELVNGSNWSKESRIIANLADLSIFAVCFLSEFPSGISLCDPHQM